VITSWEPNYGDRNIKLGHEVHEAFRSSGFSINKSKTRVLFQYERQEVTGLVVNRSANIRRKDISRLRMILFSAQKHGAEKAAKLWIDQDAGEVQFTDYISGWLSYVRQVRGESDPVLAKLCKMAVLSELNLPDWIKREADMVREFDVFLSHASEDKPKIRRLKDRLQEIGVRVFFDETSIQWGDSITEKINQGLLRSEYFIPFLTQTFAEKGWTNKELNAAIAMNISRKGRVLPIMDSQFSIDENYPLLSETLYKTWPSSEAEEEAFIDDVADQILCKIEKIKMET
jgi:RNA-directed DNA polymerase